MTTTGGDSREEEFASGKKQCFPPNAGVKKPGPPKSPTLSPRPPSGGARTATKGLPLLLLVADEPPKHLEERKPLKVAEHQPAIFETSLS